VERLIAEYIRLDQRADDAIDAYVDGLKLKCPGVPTGVLRQCEFEARALGYVRSMPSRCHIRLWGCKQPAGAGR
jgi:hypothetical protein